MGRAKSEDALQGATCKLVSVTARRNYYISTIGRLRPITFVVATSHFPSDTAFGNLSHSLVILGANDT